MSEIEIVKALQTASNKFLDALFYAFSFFGTEIMFIAVALALYWCVSKRDGYLFINIFFLCQIFVGAIKSLFKRARPYNAGARAIIEHTEGYSFPSGHSATAANIFTQLTLLARKSYKNNKTPLAKKILAAVSAVGGALTLLVMLSRMYLGQHYPSDVIFGAAWGIISALAFSAAFSFLNDKEERIVFFALPASLIAFVVLIIFKGNADYIKMAGAYGAVALGYYLEKRFVRYNVKSGALYKQVAKLCIGIAVILLVKEGLKAGILLLHAGARISLLLDYIRYALIGIIGAYGMPLLYKKARL